VAQHDYVIANGTGAAVRSDLNGALSAIVSQNSGAVEPTTTYAYMTWADTTAGVMKMRNGANSAWITLYQLDGEWTSIALEDGSAAAPSLYFRASGTDTGLYSPGADQVAVSTGGTLRLTVSTTAFTGTLPWLGASGTAAAPGISFSADSDCGMYRVGTNSIGLSTGGTVRVTIASTGDTTFAGNVLLSGTGYVDLPTGTTAQRPGTPNSGMIRYNSDLAKFEGYTTAWGSIGGGATGAGGDDVFYENGQTVTTSYTLTTNKNAVSAGPITINSGVTVTVPSGASWVVV
jgi:hypothetical protein